jgi:hypothetical protein
MRDQGVSVIQIPDAGLTLDPLAWIENAPVPIDILRDLTIRGSPMQPILNMSYVSGKIRVPERATIWFVDLYIRRFR